MSNIVIEFLKRLGPLRISLALIAIVSIVLTPEPGTQTTLTGMGVVTTLLMPAIAPMVFMGLLLDALMSRVRQVDAVGDEKKRYKQIMIFNLIMAIVLLISWLPFIIALRD